MYQLRVNEMIDSDYEGDFTIHSRSRKSVCDEIKETYVSETEDGIEYSIEFHPKLKILQNTIENGHVDFNSSFEIGEIFHPKKNIKNVFSMLRKGYVYIRKIDLTTKKSKKFHSKRSVKKLLKEQGRGWRRVYSLQDPQDRQLLKELSLTIFEKLTKYDL